MGPRGWLAKQEAMRSSSSSRSQGVRDGVPGDMVDHYMATQMQSQLNTNAGTAAGNGTQQQLGQSPPATGPTFFTYSMYEADSQSRSRGRSGRDAGAGAGGGASSSRSRSRSSASRGRTAAAASVNSGRGSTARSARQSHAYEPNNNTYAANGYAGSYSGGNASANANANANTSASASRTYGASLHQQMQQQMEQHRDERSRSKSKSKSRSRSRSSRAQSQPQASSGRSQTHSQTHSRSRSGSSSGAGASSQHSHSRSRGDATGSGYAAAGYSDHHHRRHHQGEASVYTDNTFGTAHTYSTYGGVNVTPSQISGAQNHYAPQSSYGGAQQQQQRARSSGRSRSASRSGSERPRRQPKPRQEHQQQKEQRGYFDPYAFAARSESLGSGSSSSGSSSAGSTQEEVGKKLVVQYSLVRDPSSGGGEQGRSAYSDAYSAAVIKDEVKVKARVENANLTLTDCLDLKREEEERVAKMDRVGRKMHQRASQKQTKVYSHYVTTGIDSQGDRIDASDAIGVISSYITAYRALHQTTSRTIHRHDRVLVTKAQGALGRAVVELATAAGAGQVFGICPAKYHSRVARWGATALDEEEFMTWSDGLLGAVDVVIDIDGTANGDISSAAALTANQTSGKLVRVFTNGPDGVTLAESSTRRPKSPFSRSNSGKNKNLRRDPPNTANYDVFNDMEEDPHGFQSDLQLMFDMVSQGYVCPKKKKAIPLEGMEYIEVKFERPPLRYTRDQTSGRSLSSSRGRGRRNEFSNDDKSTKSGKSARSERSRSSRGRSLSRRHSEVRDDDFDNRSRRSDYRDGDEEDGGRGRGRSRSRTRFLRSRSKSRDAGDNRSVRSSRSASRSRGGDDDWDAQSARSGYSATSARSKSSTRSASSKAGSLIKRSLSMGSLRGKGNKGGENDHSSANGAYAEVEPWKSGYDHVHKKEHGNEYSSRLLMRDMSTQSFLLALGKNPETAR